MAPSPKPPPSPTTLPILILVTIISLITWPTATVSEPVNVALNRPVEAMFSCGKFGMEYYNTLLDVEKSYGDRPQSLTCDDLRPNGDPTAVKTPSHGATKMVDGKLTTWWQSTSRNRRYSHVTELQSQNSRLLDSVIKIDLQQEFLAEEVIIQLGDALSPQKISIKKSLDGTTYTPWIYAVTAIGECNSFFSTTFTTVPADVKGSVCMGYQADVEAPGDTITLDVSSIPVSLKEWKRVRYLEIKFYDMLIGFPLNYLAHTFTHYAVRELKVMAECPCNGLQQDCQPSPTTGQYECICGGNTKGRFCESCMAKFNQYVFQHGVACQECNCFNHASSCFYQATVEQNKQSLDKDGNRKGGGRCLDCQHNTAGVNCEKCAQTYYRPAALAQTEEKACVPCGCSAAGATINPDSGVVDCVMNNDVARTDGKVPGDCFCKANVQGVKCDTCKQGFYKMDQSHDEGCIDCACFTAGTVGASAICVGDGQGQCPCKTNVTGRACDECKDGFYGLSPDKNEGCTPCACDTGGSVDQKCDKTTGQCTCRSNNIKGRTCNSVGVEFYYPGAHAIHDEFEGSYGLLKWKSDQQYAGFSGKGYAVPDLQDELNILLTIPANSKLSGNCSLVIFYRTPNGVSTNGVVDIVSKASEKKTPVTLNLPLCTGKWCQVNTGTDQLLQLSAGPNLLSVTLTSGSILLDKIVAVPVEYTKTETVLSSALPGGCDFLQNTFPSAIADKALCKQALFSLTMYHWLTPLACSCDSKGSLNAVCDANGGQCFCHTGVIGRKCDMCAADHFGFSSTGCQPCNCDRLGSSCDPVTGQCQCPENTFGRQCELCLPGSWGWDKNLGCKECNCDVNGAAFPQCNETTGICSCKPGVQGDKCNECQDNFYNLGAQGCSPCDCDMAGSISSVCNKTAGQCPCKSSTEDRQCNKCVAGSFGLHKDNPGGCLSCVCMGVTTQCTSSNIKFSSTPYGLSLTSADGTKSKLQLATADGNVFSKDIQVETDASALTSSLVFTQEAGQPALFWKMPDGVISNLMNLYGKDISVSILYINVDGQPITDLKAMILTSDGKKVVSDFGAVNQGFDHEIVVSMRESLWKLEGQSTTLERKEFLKVLARGSHVLIPATFSSGKHTSKLSRLQFDIKSEVGLVNPAVESCQCGTSYAGNSCEHCAQGFKRSNANLTEYFGVCVGCECNGHSTVCNEETSNCLNCQHNTAGKSCEECALGFYGDATKRTTTDCLACPCTEPRVVNASCHQADVEGTLTVKCDFCRDGYVGDLCHRCDASYFGNPEAAGGTCSPCQCNGNADSCDSVTGVCQNCKSNTVGNNCEECVDNFYGNASLQNCQVCGCAPTTSTSTKCDSSSGQCPCLTGVGGRTCEKCLENYWGFTNQAFTGCKPCGCNAVGSVSTQCTDDGGKCTCKADTEGDLCDSCSPNFFGLPATACEACDCNSDGTVAATICNATTGQCFCQPGVGGRKCDKCLPNHIDFTPTGCKECDQCQSALGTSVEQLKAKMSAYVDTTRTVFALQNEDTRLQALSVQLEASLKQVGISGSDATSVSDVLKNITSIQTALQASFTTTKNEVSALTTAATELHTKSKTEATEQKTMLDSVTAINNELTIFERELGSSVETLTQYSNSASKLADKGKGAGTITLDLTANKAAADQLLSQVQDVGDVNGVIATINLQKSQTAERMTSSQELTKQFDNAAVEIDRLTSELNTVAFNVAGTDNSLDEALIFKSQAEELLAAVQTILTTTENGNTALIATLASAKSTVIKANSIYSGDARPLMQGTDAIPFPNDVTNYENGKSQLEILLSAIALLINQVSTTVTGGETHVTNLQSELDALNKTFVDLPSIGKEANAAIHNYELVIEDLDQSVEMAETASKLINEVETDLSGDALQTRQTSYSEEKKRSEDLRDQIVLLDYKPQVLETTITTHQTQLAKEAEDWKEMDIKVEEMNSAAQALSKKIEDQSLGDLLDAAEKKVIDAASKSQNVAESVDAQNKVLDQKETEYETTKSQIDQVKQLDTQSRNDLNDHLAAFNSLESTLKDATTAKDSALVSTTTIAEKILLLETKLTQAENLLEKLRQPRTFDGSLSLQINNPKATSASTSDTLSLNVRKATSFTDGNIFFTENKDTQDEYEVGIKESKVFFEYYAGSEKVTITNPSEICDNCWVKVVASRLGNVGYLSVTQLPGGKVTSSSASGQTKSITSSMTLTSPLYVGSLPQDTNIPKVTNKQFQGCLMDINFENQAINLWSAAVSSNQEAKCCEAPSSGPSKTLSDGVLFTGFGFIVKSSAVLANDYEYFSFEFRTYSSSGTIFLVTSEDSQTFVSVSLSSGFVKYSTKAGDTEVSLQTDKVYNTGKWAKVKIQKNGVNQREMFVSFLDSPGSSETKSGSSVDITALDSRNLIIGASSDPFTAGTTTEQASLTLRSKVDDTFFSGCLRKVEIKQQASSQPEALNLQENVITQEGILHGACLQSIGTGLRFLTDAAYTQIKTSLSQLASIQMTFVTEEDRGILLHVAASVTGRYLYVGIFGGHIILKYQQEKSDVLLTQNMYVSNGQEHILKIHMTTSRVSMSIDGVFFEEPSNTLTTPNLSFGANVKMYLGGVPENTLSSDDFPTTKSFIGGITDLSFNGNSLLWKQSSFEQWKDVSLSGVSPPPITAETIDACATKSTPPSLPLNLGIRLDGFSSSISWSESLTLTPSLITLFENTFTLEFDFTSYKADGVLFIIANSLVSPNVYFTIYMENGKINLKMQTSSGTVRTAQLKGKYNDGLRYELKSTRNNDFATLEIGSTDIATTEASTNPTSTLIIPLNVQVFVGGIGNYEPALLPEDFNKKKDKTDFAGAFYSVSVKVGADVKTLPIALLDRTKYLAVPQKVTYGVSLDGATSYLGLGTMELTTAQTSIEVKLSTTTESALMFALYQETKYFAIDYSKNKIFLHLSPSFVGITAPLTLTVFELAGKSVLCDGVPHTLNIQFQSNKITVLLDDVSKVSTIPQSHAVQPLSAATLTVGGLADGVGHAGVSTSRMAGCVESVKLTVGSVTTDYDPSQHGSSSRGFSYGCPVVPTT